MDNEIIMDACRTYHNCKLPKKIPKTLPLLDKFCEYKKKPKIFANMDVLFIQHHLGPLIPRLEKMKELGLDPSSSWFVDIPYSTNNTVRKKLIDIGFKDEQMAPPLKNPIEPYALRQRDRVEYVIRRLADQEDHKKLLVIDDGAYFIRTLDYLLYNDKSITKKFRNRRIFIVEQTTRGHRHLLKKRYRDLLKDFKIPAVSIAKVNTKAELESPFIGASVSRILIDKIKENDLGKVLIIGFGAVGQATTEEVYNRNLADCIHVYDKAWKDLKSEIKKFDAKTLMDFPTKGYYDTVLGCTGYASFPVNKLDLLADNAILVSGSSAAIEFNRKEMIDRAYANDKDKFYLIDPERTRKEGIHTSINMQYGKKSFSFLNAGFPINFNGQIECLPPEIIQTTHTLLFAAAIETLHQTPGFHKLNSGDDEWIYNEGLKAIKDYADGN
jgi:hypothetical protein